jgi:hypothetical protein
MSLDHDPPRLEASPQAQSTFIQSLERRRTAALVDRDMATLASLHAPRGDLSGACPPRGA